MTAPCPSSFGGIGGSEAHLGGDWYLAAIAIGIYIIIVILAEWASNKKNRGR
jgi:hypothetical protein